ncbi:YqcC family protein [Shewanella youngdeokensis]|uniref:YqcC family protein n=1 Tax=Shewanella youngdeokensis TaxID=2999068 RepID=A0ABZ0JXC6_9GAMM|nr:YqcC family protein [Shewanella sp. DAU334]
MNLLTQLTRKKLINLQDELVRTQLWSDIAPSQSALQSRAPFACDTLRFEQWLQFIFIPKMHYLLDNSIALPTAIAVAPMAEQVWADTPKFCCITNILKELDELLSETK